MEKTSTTTEFSNPKSIDVTDSRIKTSNSVLMGFGGSYKLKEGHLFGEINYQYLQISIRILYDWIMIT